MRQASRASGADHPALDRQADPRVAPDVRGGSVAEVEATCRRIAEYLIDISRDQKLESALNEFLRTLERRRAELDPASRARSETVCRALFRCELASHEGGSTRERCDPFFWG